MKSKKDLKKLLIDISSEELVDDIEESIDDNISYEEEDEDEEDEEYYDDIKNSEKSMYFIHNENIDSDDPNISQFLKFCINKGFFDNTFYDMHNAFSVVATKLPQTFEKLSADGNDIHKKTFIKKFKKEYGYPGDINFIYNCLDTSEKGFITWDDFIDFFLPFVQYITI